MINLHMEIMKTYKVVLVLVLVVAVSVFSFFIVFIATTFEHLKILWLPTKNLIKPLQIFPSVSPMT